MLAVTSGNHSLFYNIGLGTGYTVLEVHSLSSPLPFSGDSYPLPPRY